MQRLLALGKACTLRLVRRRALERAAILVATIAIAISTDACKKYGAMTNPLPSAAPSSTTSSSAISSSATRSSSTAAASGSSPAPSGATILPPAPMPAPRKGMVWIPGGALVAGTPPDALPRIADEEMPGEQLILKGFYIDVFPYPNEEGAIPLTNVTEPEASGLCAEAGKRLCSELEWERACKGPGNATYEYGERYRPDVCGTGAPPSLRPSGLRVGCRSDFSVRDLHGGVWEWTQSPWGRGGNADLITLRGGNAPAGELVGRCANAMGRPPSTKSGTIGFRCCSGEPNSAEVTLRVSQGTKLEARATYDKKLARALEKVLPEDAISEIQNPKAFHIDHQWLWRPIGNEDLVVLGGCSGLGTKPSCGVLVVRIVLDRPRVLAWCSSGHWVPAVQSDVDPRDIWLFGGDELGNFRRLIAYVWGRVSVGNKERRIPKPTKKKKKK